MKEEWYKNVSEIARSGKGEEADRMVEEKVRSNPESAQDFFDRGMAFWCKRDFEPALADFSKCVEMEPDDYEANIRTGWTQRDLERYEKALEAFDKVIRLYPGKEEGYRSRANTLFCLKRFDEQLEYLEFLEKKFPDSLCYWMLGRSWTLSELGRNEEALDVLKGIDPTKIQPLPSYAYYLHLANTLCRMERFDEALNALDEGMKKTKLEDGCVPCFVNNIWKVPYFEPLRKPPYRERLEEMIGPKPHLPRSPASGKKKVSG